MSNKVDSIEHLLKPRFKVIADYPGNPWRIGDILYPFNKQLEEATGLPDVTRYSHLFKKLEWWEERAVKEMPQYVKNIADRKVFKVDKNFYNGNYSIQAFKLGEAHFTIGNTTCYYSDFLPATEADYLNQNKKQ